MEDPVVTIELCLPDGTDVRWVCLEVAEHTINRLTDAIEAILGPPDEADERITEAP